jgi:hypothetical protein
MNEPGGQRTALEGKPVLIGRQAFNRLRDLQSAMPQPRLDMRYLVEGSIELLRAQPDAQQCWLQAARDELARDLAGHAQGGQGAASQESGGVCAAACGTSGLSGAGAGTGGHQAAEGARSSTRTRARGASRAVNAEGNGCKSLLLSTEAFQRLRVIQGTTRHPRLELRYLVDGAVALLHQDVASRAAWVRQSRQALATHLAQLQQLPVPNHMEIKT